MDIRPTTKNTPTHIKGLRWRILYNNKIVMGSTVIVLLCYCIALLTIILNFSKLPPLIPLWYSKPWGPERLAHPLWLFLFPLSSIAWYTLDVLLSVFISSQFLIFSQLLLTSSVIVSIVSLFSIIKIIFLTI